VTAVPSNGCTFMRWEDASGIGTNRTLVMNASKTIRAVFGTGMGTNATSGAGAIVFSPSTGPYPYGSIVRLIGIPASNKYFSRWFNFISGPTANPYGFAVTTPNTNISGFLSNLPTNNFPLAGLLTASGNVTRSFSSRF